MDFIPLAKEMLDLDLLCVSHLIILFCISFHRQPSIAASVTDTRHHARHPQTAEREEHQDATGLLQPPHRAGAGPPRGSHGAFWRLGAWNPVLPGVSSLWRHSLTPPVQ